MDAHQPEQNCGTGTGTGTGTGREYRFTWSRTQLTLDHTCARTEAKLARPRTAPESAHRGIDNSDEFQIMIIFTLHAYRHRPRGTQAQEHKQPYSTARSVANRALVGANMHYKSRPSRLCDSAMQARQGAAGIPMASHTAVANAFMRHNGRKQAAHGQSKPPPTASFDRELRRCGSAALDAEEQATAQLGGQLHCVGVARPVAQCSLHPVIYLPRAARLERNSAIGAEEGVIPARDRMLAHR